MSGKRERPPSGRHNARNIDKQDYVSESPVLSSRPQSARVRNPSPRNNNDFNNYHENNQKSNNNHNHQEPRRMNRPVSATATAPSRVHLQNSHHHHHIQIDPATERYVRPTTASSFPPSSPNIDSTESVVQKLRDKIEIEKRAAESEKTRLLGEYNAFSRPKNSVKYPLRSSLLDPEVNNIPPSKTRTELMKKLKISAIPHPSYDIDGDGWVSQEDYKLSKRFDFDGNGVIDPDEREVAKHVIADEFFRTNADHIRIFGKQFAKRTHEENIESLEKAHCFERTLRQLKSIEEGFRSRSSKDMVRCMSNENVEMSRCHFYNDKADTVAFTDYDAMPRTRLPMTTSWSSPSFASQQRGSPSVPPYENTITEHHGSRRMLMLARKEQAKQQASALFDSVTAGAPKFRAQKLSLISDFSLEN